MIRMSILALVTVSMLATACGLTGVPRSQPSSQPLPEPTAPKTLTIAVPGEPGNVAIPTMGDVPTGSTGGGDLKLSLHHRLATYDDRGEVHPMLAAELPSQAAGTWVLRPDGTMQTTYRLRQNVTWHDGTPLTTKDFVFGWTVTTNPDIPVSTRLGSQIARIDTPDDHTLVYEWEGTYPFANALVEDELAPLPSHLIESTYQTDKERFLQLGYWTREFVGTGPFRMDEWEPGSHIVAKAYDQFYAGKPRIDTLVFRFIADEGGVVAGLLAGALDGTMSRALDFNRSVFVKQEWERGGKAPVFIAQTTHWRLLEVQLRAEIAKPRDLLDPRVRRGLLHTLDRQSMVDSLLAGQAPPSDTFIPPDDTKWDWVKEVVTRYEFDPRRAEAALADAGWRRGTDGNMVDSAGERVVLPLWTRPGEPGERELAIIADGWKNVGVGADQVVLSPGQARDSKVIATFPGFTPTSNPLAFENTLQVLSGRLCPTEESRWSGRNHGCYTNPEWDSLVGQLRAAIDPGEQRQLWRDLVRIYTSELPVLPLYFNIQVVMFRDGVTGVRGDTRPRTSPMWNSAEWDIATGP